MGIALLALLFAAQALHHRALQLVDILIEARLKRPDLAEKRAIVRHGGVVRVFFADGAVGLGLQFLDRRIFLRRSAGHAVLACLIQIRGIHLGGLRDRRSALLSTLLAGGRRLLLRLGLLFGLCLFLRGFRFRSGLFFH